MHLVNYENVGDCQEEGGEVTENRNNYDTAGQLGCTINLRENQARGSVGEVKRVFKSTLYEG